MRRTDCTELYYFDPNTKKCHPCSDCGPGRSPIKFCEDKCIKQKKGKIVVNIVGTC